MGENSAVQGYTNVYRGGVGESGAVRSFRAVESVCVRSVMAALVFVPEM